MKAPFFRCVKFLILGAACASLGGCGLIKAPFRVAGALTNGAYEGGKKVTTATSNALERRKNRKEKEKAEAAKLEAKENAVGEDGGGLVPGSGIMPAGNHGTPGPVPVEKPLIPVDDPVFKEPDLPLPN